MNRYQQYITHLYLNNPVALIAIVWALGLTTGMIITYLMMR